ncbi:MAG: hypothetical protein HYT87_18450, partial [Nitrospirae bacterium]|nr:hypothetical protein [Nitrospirota bacterium]
GVPPSVTVEQNGGQADPANTLPVVFDVTFSESVTGFDQTDLTWSGTATGITASVSGSGATYTINVTAVTGNGTLIPDIGVGLALDAAGNGNTASSSTDNTVTYDNVAPSAPVVGSLTVTMNAPGTNDTLSGVAAAFEAASTVKVYSDALLTTLIGSGPAAGDGSLAPISIGDNQADGSDQIYVTATDAAGNQSTSTIKINDVTAPAAPTGLTLTQNASPTADQLSGAIGAVEASATVKVYSDVGLTTLVSSSAAIADGSFAAFNVGDNAAATLYVTATDAGGNPSTSTSVANDITAPAAPVLGNLTLTQNAPGVQDQLSGAIGAVEASATIKVYSDVGLTTLVSSTTAIADGSFAAFNVGDNVAATLYVTAVDAAGNQSASTSVANDITAPAAPVLGNLTLTQNAPGVQDQLSGAIGAVEASATVKVYSDVGLTTLVSSTTAIADGSFAAFNVGDNAASTLYVTATDAAGNQSASTSVANDITAPAAPVGANLTVTMNASPTADQLSGAVGAVEGSATVKVYQDALLTSQTGTTTAAADGSFIAFGIGNNLATASDQIYVTATDATGNVSTATIMTNDVTAPAAPTGLTLTQNASPTADQLSGTIGAVEASATVKVYSDVGLTTLVSSTAAIADGSFAAFNVGDNAAATLYVTATDAAGNASTATSVANDITAPAAPVLGNLTLTQNAPGTADQLSGAIGAVEASATVQVYSDVGLTTLVSSTAAIADGSFAAFNVGDNAAATLYVTSVDAAGNRSSDTSLPNDIAAPTDMTANFQFTNAYSTTGNSIDVSWTAFSDNVAITNHRLFTYTDGACTTGAEVQAYDAAGNSTTSACSSDSIIVDAAAPAAPVAGSLTVAMNGPGVQDQLSGSVGAVEASATVKVYSDGLLTTLIGSGSAIADGSFVAFNIGDNQSDGSDLIYVVAVDAATNQSAVTSKTNDKTPPTFAGAVVATTISTTAIDVMWNAGSDAVTATGNLVYDICQSTTPGGCATFTPTYTSAAGVSFHNVTGLTAGTRYYFVARAKDQAGNADTNSVEKSATTQSTGIIQAVSAGGGTLGGHTCSLMSDGTVRCWGDNDYGQIGDGTTADTSSPVSVSGLTQGATVSISGGSTHTCALAFDGTAKCWGRNFNAQLGDGTSTDRPTPVAVSTLTSAVMIAAGQGHTCAVLSDGSARCWGANNYGQVGDGTLSTRTTPVVVTSLTNAVSISPAILSYSCAVISDGTVKCWGYNGSGQLGDGTNSDKYTPVAVSTLTGAVSVTTASGAGGGSSCALLSDGMVRCWGYNYHGQLGDGTTVNTTTPVAVSSLTGAVAINGGEYYICALTSDGTVRCWGYNGYGQLGDGTTTNKPTPVAVSSLTGAVAVSAGNGQTCALLSDGTVKCWGFGQYGQLGDGTTANRLTPTAVSMPAGNLAVISPNLHESTASGAPARPFRQGVAGGQYHTCSLVSGGTIRCWGRNLNGQLGEGSTTDSILPVAVSALSSAVDVASGEAHSCSLLSDGTVRCWGSNSDGQLGDGSTAQNSVPVAVSALSSALAVAAGQAHSCALISDGTAKCWGDNVVGQLGNGTSVDSLFPVVVSGLTSAVGIETGDSHTCAVSSDGIARCWGWNNFGQLGDGTTADKIFPTIVSGLTNAALVSTGWNHTCAMLTNGTVKCWGKNAQGQLGDGTSTDKLIPNAIPGLIGVTGVSAGQDHTCVLKSDGAARCWGYNANGQLGDGSTITRLSPVIVTGITSAVAIDASNNQYHTCALIADGKVKCWGYNIYGQLGNGNTTDSPIPVLVDLKLNTAAPTPPTLTSTSPASPSNATTTPFIIGTAPSGTTVKLYTNGTCASAIAASGPASNFASPGLSVTVTANTSTTYWATATDGEGRVSTCSSGSITYTHDNIAPTDNTANLQFTAAVSNTGNNLAVTWTAFSDTNLSDHRLATYTDSACTAGFVDHGFTGSTTNSDSVIIGPLANGTYWGKVIAFDSAGNSTSSACSTDSIIVDATPPTFSGIGGTTAVSSTQIDLSWTAASDTITAQANIVYDICQTTTSGGCSAFTATYISTPGAVSYSVTGLTTGTRYYFVVRSRDEAGNSDTNTVEKSALTWSTTGVAQAVTTHLGNHTCSLSASGGVKCWGFNGFGQLGDGTTVDKTTPLTVSSLSNGIAVAGGYSHTCSLLSDGTVKCWGRNFYGQLGDGTTADKSTPVAVSSLSGGVAVAAGAQSHTCSLLSDGTVKCWGRNNYGQLGDGTTADKLTPVTVSNLSNAVAAAVGNSHTCSLLSDGTVKCWGYNNYGQLGDGTTADKSIPVAVSALSAAVAVAGGYSHTCSLLSDGTVKCWGYNANGGLGDGTTANKSTPVAVSALSAAVAVAGGSYHTCSLLSDGTVKCWGFNTSGQLGDGTTVNKSTPVSVTSLSGAIAAAGGYAHTCSLVSDGTAKCWGTNGYGELGDGTSVNKSTPVAVSMPAGPMGVKLPRLHESTASGASARPFREGISAHLGSHTCALISDGTVKCWGYNVDGQLGDGTTTNRLTPTAVSSLSSSLAVAGGGNHACALLSDGTVQCWGKNQYGQLGDGTTTNRTTPVAVSTLSAAVAVAGGSSGHTCSLLSDGTVKCWGRNLYGQLGDGYSTDRQTPVTVTSLSGGLTLAGGLDHTCALLSDGTVKCWGRNQVYQLGDGTTANRLTPTAVSSLSGVVAVAAGSQHTCSLLSDGTAKCWGWNTNGQLGDGTATNRPTPTSVSSLSGVIAIAGGGNASYSHTCALKSDGTGWCWGFNNFGQLGDGTTASKTTPIAVSTLAGGVVLTVGSGSTCAVLSDGSARCWGGNGQGQLGDGTTTTRTTPVPVTNLP